MKVEPCEFLGKVDKDGSIKIKPLGRASNNIKQPMLAGWNKVVTKIILDKKFEKGLIGIEDYSHVIIVYFMDKEKECHLRHHPQGRKDIPYIGIFACRCPQRPNRIAFSTVKLISRSGNVLKVKGLDILDGTPIVDIKPYTPQYDLVKDSKVPAWVKKLTF